MESPSGSWLAEPSSVTVLVETYVLPTWLNTPATATGGWSTLLIVTLTVAGADESGPPHSSVPFGWSVTASLKVSVVDRLGSPLWKGSGATNVGFWAVGPLRVTAPRATGLPKPVCTHW